MADTTAPGGTGPLKNGVIEMTAILMIWGFALGIGIVLIGSED